MVNARAESRAESTWHALLAGGGTGGHVFPALAVGEELTARGWQVTYAGSRKGLEADLVARRGFDFVELPARPLVGRSPIGQARALWTLGRSMLAARRTIRDRGVDVVVGTGGYVSAPAVLGARLTGRLSLLVEPNVEAGLANRWLSRWADGAAVAYQRTADQLHCPAWVTGVPVRRAFFEVPDPAPEEGPEVALLVLGGSQGARQLNLTVPEALARLEQRHPELARRLTVLHQAGRNQLDEAREAYRTSGPRDVAVEVVPFIEEVAAALAAAHLVISRSGALATAELCAAGRASILVPLALAAGHQTANARLLADAGAARVLSSEELTPEALMRVLADLVGDPQALRSAGRAARGLARREAVAAIAERLEALVGAEVAPDGESESASGRRSHGRSRERSNGPSTGTPGTDAAEKVDTTAGGAA